MHTRPTSQIDEAAGLAYAAARGFGLVIASDAGRPVASPLPFVVEPANAARRLAFHVARGNRLAELAAQGGSWLLVVMGPDAYVSPDWYDSAEQVPTWLYETVHLSGAVRVMSDPQKRDHLDRLSATFEAWHAPKPPWTADKLTPARHAAFMQAIVAIEMTVEMVEMRPSRGPQHRRRVWDGVGASPGGRIVRPLASCPRVPSCFGISAKTSPSRRSARSLISAQSFCISKP